MVSVAGRGLDARAESWPPPLSADIPKETAALLRPAIDAASCPAASLAKAQAQLAETAAALVGELLAEAGLARRPRPGRRAPRSGILGLEQGEVVGYLGLVRCRQAGRV